uniref:MADF domain-containing protein n=2 Tax=Bactrocera latifrons TaxID=174628 RepID=A0A0K8V021_BACLA
MSSYSFRGAVKKWIPREEDQTAPHTATDSQQRLQLSKSSQQLYSDAVNDKWSVKQLMRLLRLYGAHNCLWDTRHPDNRNRKFRKAALIDITAAMGEGTTCAQVLQKINVLRATYRYEKRRIKQRIRRGIGAKTKLKWFALADSFLRNVPKSEMNKKREDADSDSDLEDALVFTIEPEVLTSLSDGGNFQNDDLYIKEEFDQVIIVFLILLTHAFMTHQTISALTVLHLDLFHYDFAFFPLITISFHHHCPSTPNGAVNKKSFFVQDNIRFPTVSSPENVSPLQRKSEQMSTSVKRKWTTHESLQFIFLLRSYPLLWQLDINDPLVIEQQATEQEKALEEISHTMQLPKQRLRRRLETFIATYRREMEAIKLDSQHKPRFTWWPMVQEYLETPQLTKINISENMEEDNKQKLNEMAPLDSFALDGNTDQPNNALYLSAPSSPTVSQIFSPASPANNEDSIGNNDTYTAERQNFSNPPLKLIWNGLEDDLLEGKWSLKHSVKFLRLYGAHRCLWDLNDPDYRSREMRAAAIEDIAAAMGYGLDADYVAKKIKIFRITYMQHRKRMLEAIKQNRAPDVQLRWFPLADSFLRPHIGLRSIKEQEREMPQFDFQYVYANLNLIDPSLLADLK